MHGHAVKFCHSLSGKDSTAGVPGVEFQRLRLPYHRSFCERTGVVGCNLRYCKKLTKEYLQKNTHSRKKNTIAREIHLELWIMGA